MVESIKLATVLNLLGVKPEAGGSYLTNGESVVKWFDSAQCWMPMEAGA